MRRLERPRSKLRVSVQQHRLSGVRFAAPDLSPAPPPASNFAALLRLQFAHQLAHVYHFRAKLHPPTALVGIARRRRLALWSSRPRGLLPRSPGRDRRRLPRPPLRRPTVRPSRHCPPIVRWARLQNLARGRPPCYPVAAQRPRYSPAW